MKVSLSCAMGTLERKKPYIAVILVQLIYAGMALFSKAAIAKGMNPYVFVVYRQAFATLALAPFAFFLESKKAAALSYTLLWKIFLISLFGLTLGLNLYYLAINYISATLAAASTSTIPAITFVMAVLLRMENCNIKQWHGIVKVLSSIVGVTGAFVFGLVKGPPIKFMNWHSDRHNQISGPSMKHSSKEDWIKGSLIMLSANTVWSLCLIMQASIVKQYPLKLRLLSLQCFFSCIQSTIFAIVMRSNISSWKLRWDVNLFSVAYCGVVVAGLSFWLRLCVIEKKGPVFTAMFSPLGLLITAIFSALLLGEILHWGSVCGAILLVGGLYCFLWSKNREVERKTNEQKSESKEENMLECITHK